MMTNASADTSAQEALFRALSSCRGARVLETHISYILLTGEFAFKIKKAVNLGFLDFTTLDARRHYCERELELNRRLAPQLYLGVVPITGTPESPRIDGPGPAIEYAVKMREFAQDALLSRVLAAGQLTVSHIDQLAEEIAAFHGLAERVPADAPFGSADQVLALAIENFTEIEPLLPAPGDRRTAAAIRAWTEQEHASHRDVFRKRREAGSVRACHADLHLGNIVLFNGRPTLFDCVEFNDAIRWSDVMADVGFLTMDLIDHRRPGFASRFLNAYLEITGDYEGLRVLRFYAVYRAMVRAKVACMRASQIEDALERKTAIQESRQYLRLARRLTRSRDAGLIITHGPAASGKTTATQILVETLNAVRVRTDVERKRLHGLPALARTHSDLNRGVYSAADTARTYEAVAAIAKTIIEAGFVAIADGAFLRRWQRDRFAALADEMHVPFAILSLQVDRDTLAARVMKRQLHGDDASEAGPDVLERQLESQEPLGRDEEPLAVIHARVTRR